MLPEFRNDPRSDEKTHMNLHCNEKEVTLPWMSSKDSLRRGGSDVQVLGGGRGSRDNLSKAGLMN